MAIEAGEPLLVADIGGTNAKFGIASSHQRSGQVAIYETRNYPCVEFDSLVEVIQVYREQVLGEWPRLACIAVAGPVLGARVHFTNLDWQVDFHQLKAAFGFDELLLINDFVTQAYATLYLTREHLHCLRPGTSVPGTPRLVLGPGTGLGVAALSPVGSSWIPQPGEGGHVNFAPANALQCELHRVLSKHSNFVSVEDLVSGSGLARLYLALGQIRGEELPVLEASEITATALAYSSGIAREAVEVFLSILGSAAGNAALTLGAFGGVYFTGGILPKIEPLIGDSGLLSAFEDKGPMQSLLSETPLYLVTGPTPALAGAARLLIDRLGLEANFYR